MKFLKIILLLIIIFFVHRADAQSAIFVVSNSLNIQRSNELISLNRTDIEKHLGMIKDDIHLEIFINNKAINFQLVDSINNDWNRLIFLSSFKPKEKKFFTLKLVLNKKYIAIHKTQQLAHVRLKPKNTDSTFGESITLATMPYQNAPTDFSKQSLPYYLTEGPAWENDKVAFRLYFDTRNTIDIYGKRVAGMVMDTVGANPEHSYHDLAAWGMDILHVVKSLGAGSLAIKTKDENGKDTLIRLGGSNIQKETYNMLADGPLLASFEMNYEWQVNNKPVKVTEQISIWSGQYFYESKVVINDAPKDAELITGIGDFYDNKADSFKVDNAAVLLSFGKQSENKDELGMAIIQSKQNFVGFTEAPNLNSDITESHLSAQKIINNEPITFRFYSCWSKTDNKFSSGNYFKNYIQQEAQKFSEPLLVKW